MLKLVNGKELHREIKKIGKFILLISLFRPHEQIDPEINSKKYLVGITAVHERIPTPQNRYYLRVTDDNSGETDTDSSGQSTPDLNDSTASLSSLDICHTRQKGV